MISTMEAFSGLENARIEGLEAIVLQYNNIVDATKTKNYDILDHRKQEVRDSAFVLFSCKIVKVVVSADYK